MPGTVLKLKLLILDGLQVHDTKSPASYRPNRELLGLKHPFADIAFSRASIAGEKGRAIVNRHPYQLSVAPQ